MYRSYSYNDMPKPIMHPYEKKPQKNECKEENHQKPIKKKEEKNDGFLANLETDDFILLIVILALILDDCDDKILLIALGFVFICQFLD